MWVCLCKGVTDTTIRKTVNDGARTTLDVALACQAGTGCGGCLPEVRNIIDCHLAADNHQGVCPLFTCVAARASA